MNGTTQPISQQPSNGAPQLLLAPLSGLEDLIAVEKIKFRQQIQMVKIFCGCDMPINFEMINEHNQIIYQTEETSGCCLRNCVPQGMRTETVLAKMDCISSPALRFMRESRCVLNCCLPCCCFPLPFSRERLTVTSPGGTILGTISHDWSCWTSRFTVRNAAGEILAKIEGPSNGNFTCCADIAFKVHDLNGHKIGNITKHYRGMITELFTDFDDFTIHFSRDLDVGTKATLLGAVHLINFLFFEGAFRKMLMTGVCGAYVSGVAACMPHPRN